MGRGRKPTRGGRRQFTDVETLKQQSREINRRAAKDDSSEEDDDDLNPRQAIVNRQGAVGELPPSESESEESEDDTAAGDKKSASNAGTSGQQKGKQAAGLSLNKLSIDDDKRGLNRKEREEVARQEAKRKYQALTAAGKTDEAKADLARLAIIRQQREEAAKKRELEQKAKEAAAKAKAEERSKSQGKKTL